MDATAPKVVNRNMPGCTVIKTVSVGVSVDRTEVVMIVETKEQGEIALKIPLDAAAPFSFSAEAARKAANAVLPTDQQQVPALVVKDFEIGRTDDIEGVLFTANQRTINEEILLFSDNAARAAGNALLGASFKKDKAPTIIHNRMRGILMDQLGRPVSSKKSH